MIQAPAPPYLVHVWAWRARAVRVPTSGRPPGLRLTFGSWQCSVCGILRAWACKYDRREIPGGDCPGGPPGGLGAAAAVMLAESLPG